MRRSSKLRFNLVGYGCTTCIGNSGPLPDAVSKPISDHELVVVGVLSRQSQLRRPRASRSAGQLPRLAAAGRRLRPRRADRHRLRHRAARHRHGRQSRLPQRHLADAAGSARRGQQERAIAEAVRSASTHDVFNGDENWKALAGADRRPLPWDANIHLRQAPAVLPRHDRSTPAP